MRNEQANRQLRKKLAQLGFELESLRNHVAYVSSFVEFLGSRGIDVAGFEREFRSELHDKKAASGG